MAHGAFPEELAKSRGEGRRLQPGTFLPVCVGNSRCFLEGREGLLVGLGRLCCRLLVAEEVRGHALRLVPFLPASTSRRGCPMNPFVLNKGGVRTG